MRWAVAIAVCFFSSSVLAADGGDPWFATAPIPETVADIRDHPLEADRVVPVRASAREDALTLLAPRRVVRLDAAAYTRLSGRSGGWPAGLKPYLVRSMERDDSLGSNHIYAVAGHALVEYNGPIEAAECRHAALILLLPTAPELHISMLLYF